MPADGNIRKINNDGHDGSVYGESEKCSGNADRYKKTALWSSLGGMGVKYKQ